MTYLPDHGQISLVEGNKKAFSPFPQRRNESSCESLRQSWFFLARHSAPLLGNKPEMKCFRSVKTTKTRFEFRMEDILKVSGLTNLETLTLIKTKLSTAEMSRDD